MSVSPELDARFRAAAVRDGLVDVRYDLVESPVGQLVLAATERGLCRISYTVDGADDELARSFGARVLRTALDEVRRELDEYFAGRRQGLDLRASGFQEAVLHELARVPYGQTDTYGHLAAKVGKPRAARAVGMVMN